MRAWRRAAGTAVVGVLALGASLAAAGQAQAAAPAISVAASTKLPLVTHDALVVYQEGAYASAKIHGAISGAGTGEVARLYAQPFPYKKAATAVAGVTLKASKASYSFTVSPSLATHYRVRLFKSKTAAAPVAGSSLQTVYVASPTSRRLQDLRSADLPRDDHPDDQGAGLGTEHRTGKAGVSPTSGSASRKAVPPSRRLLSPGTAGRRPSAGRRDCRPPSTSSRSSSPSPSATTATMGLERVLEGRGDQRRNRPARQPRLRGEQDLCIDPLPGLTTSAGGRGCRAASPQP